MSKESRFIIFVAVLASLLEIIDTSIVNVALPTMMGNLGATLEDISMVITGYAIANAIILPVSAWFSNRLGRRTYYLGCIFLFTLTSLLCGIAPNLETLTLFRILQGLFGGALLPTSQALIYEQFPKEKAGMAGAIFGMSVMIGPTLGPVMGGYLTDQFNWRAIFNINLPLGLLAFFLGMMVIKDASTDKVRGAAKNNPRANLPDSELTEEERFERRKNQLDWIGFSLLIMGIGCLQFVLERGEALDWFSSRTILVNTFLSVVSLPAFVWWQLRIPNPIINVRLFKNPLVINGVLLMASLGFFLYGIVFLLPVFVGRSFHYTATQTGILFIPGSLVTMALMGFIGKQMQSGTHPKLLIATGFISLEICMWMMSHFSPFTGRDEILRMLLVRGVGMAFLFVPINSSILSQFSGKALGEVAGLLNLFRQIGGSVGIALIGTLLQKNSAQNTMDLLNNVTRLSPGAENSFQMLRSGMLGKLSSNLGMIPNTQSPALYALWNKIQAQAFMMSFLQLITLMMIILGFAFIPLYFIGIKPQKGAKPIDAH